MIIQISILMVVKFGLPVPSVIWDSARLVQAPWIFLVQVSSFLPNANVGEQFFEVSLGHIGYFLGENTTEKIGKNLGFFVVVCCTHNLY